MDQLKLHFKFIVYNAYKFKLLISLEENFQFKCNKTTLPITQTKIVNSRESQFHQPPHDNSCNAQIPPRVITNNKDENLL